MTSESSLSTLEYHVLLSMAVGPLYGYAIKESVESESEGAVAPRAGSLYRVLARLMSHGLVRQAEPEEQVEPHPGRERKYYALTGEGRRALRDETRRLKVAVELAERRLKTAGGRS